MAGPGWGRLLVKRPSPTGGDGEGLQIFGSQSATTPRVKVMEQLGRQLTAGACSRPRAARRRHGRGFRRGDWLFSIDLESGYYHISIKEEHCKFLGFQWGGKFFEFRVLPFGLSSAPFAFTKVMKQLANFWRTDGIRLMVYLDDWCFMAESVEEAERLVTLITAQMKTTGLLINAGKSVRRFPFFIGTNLSLPLILWRRI